MCTWILAIQDFLVGLLVISLRATLSMDSPIERIPSANEADTNNFSSREPFGLTTFRSPLSSQGALFYVGRIPSFTPAGR